jgi:hypothetical protein
VDPLTERRKHRLGAPPSDWLTKSDVVQRESGETKRLRKIGGPPPEFRSGEADDDEKARSMPPRPLITLVVSEDREAAAHVVIALARARVSIRLALGLAEAETALDGAAVVFVVVPPGDSATARSLASWGQRRVVFALVRDANTAARVRPHCQAVLEPPWDVEAALRCAVP